MGVVSASATAERVVELPKDLFFLFDIGSTLSAFNANFINDHL